ncbi:MAG TPA: PepSY domain-containing protein [Polyangiaceae bacterium]|nr:PepSY domain-containing protein [Polyangiaceae bacterium]
MKLSRHAFTRFWSLHAWAGVVAGLALHLMFLTGAVTLFREQVSTWEEPRLQRPRAARNDGPAEVFERALGGARPAPSDVWVTLSPGGERATRLDYDEPATGARRSLWVDPQTGALRPRREGLSDFLYGVHFLSHAAVPWLAPAAGLLAVALLLAIVTGVLIHVKDIVRQFYQFRPGRSRRVLWSDMHKVLGVMGLPFQTVYAYTGAYIVLLPYALSAFTGPVFGGDEARAEEAAWGFSWPAEVADAAAVPALPLDALLERARAAEPGLRIDSVSVHRHGLAGGFVDVRGAFEGSPRHEDRVRLRESDGQVLAAPKARARARGAGDGMRAWVYGLHFVHFEGLAPKALFFLLAIAASVTILTGNLVWLARREARAPGLGNRLLARLTAGFGAGSFVAIAATFAASRALPLDWGGRVALEELTFVAALGLCAAWALVARPGPAPWWHQLGLAGGLLLATPLLAARRSTAGLFGGGEALAPVVGVDVALLAAGGALCLVAWAIWRASRRSVAAGLAAEAPPRPEAGMAPTLARGGGPRGEGEAGPARGVALAGERDALLRVAARRVQRVRARVRREPEAPSARPAGWDRVDARVGPGATARRRFVFRAVGAALGRGRARELARRVLGADGRREPLRARGAALAAARVGRRAARPAGRRGGLGPRGGGPCAVANLPGASTRRRASPRPSSAPCRPRCSPASALPASFPAPKTCASPSASRPPCPCGSRRCAPPSSRGPGRGPGRCARR